MNIGTLIYILLRCRKVGTDHFGNIYYISNERGTLNKYKRLVKYSKKSISGEVPPVWNAWLRYSTDIIPSSDQDKLQKENIKKMYYNDSSQSKKFKNPYKSWKN